MSGFQRGDLALCINSKPDRVDPKAALLHEGRVYRVATVGTTDTGVSAIGFRELPSDRAGQAWGWSANRFRKIRPASKAFTADMRALKPHRDQVPA